MDTQHEFYENTIRFPAQMKADMKRIAAANRHSFNLMTVILWEREIAKEQRKRRKGTQESEK